MLKKVGFIGAGNMAGAIIEGILKTREYQPSDLAVCDKIRDKTIRFQNAGLNVADSIKELAENSDILFLAVKPQDYEKVLLNLKPSLDKTKLLVSIAAGISTGYIKDTLGFDCKVVRAMPNTPLLLGEGATALCQVPPVGDAEFAAVKRIFEAGGIVSVLPEDQMNAIISINSTSPAYVYLFAKAVIDGGRQQGINEEIAKAMFCKTLVGSAAMIMHSGKSPEELVKMVASPGGTTLAALDVLYEHNFENIVIEAMKHCTKRAEELGR